MQVKIAKQEGYAPWVQGDTVKTLNGIDSIIRQLQVARAWFKKELEKNK